jgi:ATP-dependent Clp protease ATP-binding subunit ClpA
MLRTFTDMATMRSLLEAAERESTAMGEVEPGAEHVVLAALGLPDGSAREAVAELGADAASLRRAISEVHVQALGVLGIDQVPAALPTPRPTGRGLYRAKGSTRDLLKATAEAKRALGARQFVTAHVLVGAATLERGTLPMALARLGIEPAELRACAVRHAQSTAR